LRGRKTHEPIRNPTGFARLYEQHHRPWHVAGRFAARLFERAESGIDTYTRRNFVGTAGTVYYNRYSQNVRGNALYLYEDVVSLVAIQNGDGQAIPLGSVWLEPRNAGPPYRIVRFHSQYVYIWNTDSDVTISGTFGFSTTAPETIKMATLEYASHIFRTKDVGPLDVAGNPDMGEVKYPKGMPESVKIKLSPFRSRSGGVV
jgi:hypothetical protein